MTDLKLETKDQPEGVTRLIVNITDRAVAALNTAAEVCGDSKTDTVSRALISYAEIVGAPVGTVISINDMRLHVVRGATKAEV